MTGGTRLRSFRLSTDTFRMVVRDLSNPEVKILKHANRDLCSLPLGPVSDRFVAVVLDFLILSPVVSFCVASYLRDLKTILIINSDSDEAAVIWIFFVMCIVALSTIIQAIFLYFWQATPGQKFMQLSVVSFPQSMNQTEELTFAQCLLRPIGWWLSAAMAGLPFLETVGHPLRRAIHERMSDTLVISLKRQPVDRPLAVETKYISSTLWLFYGLFFAIGLTMMAKTYKTALMQGMTGAQAVSEATCAEISADKYKDQSRLDVAVALYLAKEVDNACVYNEAQKVIWSEQGEAKALGELAMAMASEDEKDVASYHAKVCSTSVKSEACAISKYLLSETEDRGDLLRRSGLSLISSRVVMLGNLLENHNFVAAAGMIHDLEKESPLKAFLESNRVRIAWALNAKVNAKNARSPASLDEKEILEEFKERYSLK